MTKKRPGTLYGRRLREARESCGYSQTGLGIAVGLDESGAGSLISRYENGIHQPKLGRQELFARALKLPLTYFYTEDDQAARVVANAAHGDKPAQGLIGIKGRTKHK